MAERMIYKSSSAEFLDGLFGGDADSLREAYRKALEILDQFEHQPLAEAAELLSERGELPEDSAEKSRQGWRDDPDVDRVIKHGYRAAIELADRKEPPVPIATLWMTGAADDFELHICDGPAHVTVVLVIPVHRDYGSNNAKAKSWVVRSGDSDESGNPVSIVQVSGPQVAAT